SGVGDRGDAMSAEPAIDEAMLDVFELSAAHQASPLFDPFPSFAAARERGRVQEAWPLPIDLPMAHANVPVVNVLGYVEVSTVLRDSVPYSSSLTADAMGPLLGHTIVAMDPPEHAPHRALVAPAFRPKLLAAWEDVLIRKVVDDVIDTFASHGSTDLARTFT